MGCIHFETLLYLMFSNKKMRYPCYVVMKWPLPITNDPGARLYDQQKNVNHDNSHGRCEKRSHESWKLFKVSLT